MTCTSCGTLNREDRRFCSGCGASLPGPCPSCGFANEPAARFCGGCGVSLAGPSPVAPAEPAPRVPYTPRHLVEKIRTSRAALEGERKQVTVLFADLKGSMELLAERDPEDARALLDGVLERMMQAVHRFEGTVNQVMGDGIMALFGAPLAHEDHAVRACYAALRMQESVGLYSAEVQRTLGATVQIRVGLNSGEVVVRSIGSDLRMDYTAVGQTTHLAARMEQAARPGSVLMTGITLRLADPWVQARAIGATPVKGIPAPVEIYELTGATVGRSPQRIAASRWLGPFVGRDEELARIGRALDRARQGRGQVVAVAGDAGVGKTRLVHQRLHATRAAEGCTVLEGAAVSYGHTTAFLPLTEILRAYLEIDDRDPPARVIDKVARRIRALPDGLDDAVPPLLALLEVLPADDPLFALEPAERRGRTLSALRRLLIAESRRRPVVLVVENLHWIDAESEALLDDLVRHAPDAPLLLVVSFRPEYRHAWAGLSHVTHVRLHPLPPDRTDLLLTAILGRHPTLEPVRELLIERTEGNPLFLEESVRSLVETGVLVGERGAYRMGAADVEPQLPATVQAVLAARVDRLPPEEKSLLQSAAVIGRHVPLALLEAIAGLPEEPLHRGLGHLQTAGFLHEASLFPELEYSLRHALTYEVVYGSLLRERRRALHARIVDELERLYGDRLATQVERLAYHAFRAERWDQALAYHRQAGAKAAAGGANREAVAHFEAALEALARLPLSREHLENAVDLRLDLRPPLLRLGRLPEVLGRSREAEEIAGRLGDESRLASVYSYLSNYHYLRGEPDVALGYGERCLALAATRRDPALEGLARQYIGQIRHAQGQYELAREALERNVQALGSSDPASVAYVASCAWLAWTLAELGELDQAQRRVTEAAAAAESTDQAYARAIAWTLAAVAAIRSGHLARAVLPLERSLELCRLNHLTVWLPVASALLGLTFVRMGHPGEGLHLLEEGVALSEELGIRVHLARWTAALAEGLLAADRPDRAGVRAERALELAQAHGEAGHEAEARWLLGEIAAAAEPPDVERAAAEYGRAVALAQQLGMRPLLALSHRGLADLWERAGNFEKAAGHRASAAGLVEAMHMRPAPPWPEAEAAELGHLFIVARWSDDLYEFLRREFAQTPNVTVVLDRRQGEPRPVGLRPEADRRSASVDGELRAWGLAVLPRGRA